MTEERAAENTEPTEAEDSASVEAEVTKEMR